MKNMQMKKSTLPVSTKFYSEIHSRVHDSVMAVTGNRPAEAQRVFAAIDRYITHGIAPAADADTLIVLTFSLLRPEIDKAMARSKRARQRSLRRREATVRTASTPVLLSTEAHETAETIETSEAVDPNATTETEPPMNRRQRRLIDMACRRVARKLARRNLQTKSAGPHMRDSAPI